jgi:hypothetical protein
MENKVYLKGNKEEIKRELINHLNETFNQDPNFVKAEIVTIIKDIKKNFF